MRFDTSICVTTGLMVACGVCLGAETADPGALSPALASIPAWTEAPHGVPTLPRVVPGH